MPPQPPRRRAFSLHEGQDSLRQPNGAPEAFIGEMDTILPFLAAISGGGLISLLINLLIIGLIGWLLFWLVNFINPPEPFKKILLCILAIAFVVLLINALLSISGGGFIDW